MENIDKMFGYILGLIIIGFFTMMIVMILVPNTTEQSRNCMELIHKTGSGPSICFIKEKD